MVANRRWSVPLLLLALWPGTGPAQTAYRARVDPHLVLVNSFEGWGTSLCWWGNIVGGYANRATYASLAFSQLKLNIVRYNIGGGENPNIPNTMELRARMPGFEPANGVWNWNVDANQRWMLHQAIALGADRVVAFANSPPWWMTVSGSVTGSTNGTSNNLQTGFEQPFAVYLATVMSNLTALDGVSFESVTPMNEPTANWWRYGGHQEGCHMSSDQQARVVNDLRAALNARGLRAGIVASEDNDEQSTINSLGTYSATAMANVYRVVSHTYGPNNPTGLRNLAALRQKPLWVSEYGDGDASGMTMARRIHDDLSVLWARAWVYWQVVDNAGGWGFLLNPMDGSGNTAFSINKKFYVMGQFSEFVRPGSQLLSVDDDNSLAAYNPTNNTLVLVAVNDSTNTLRITYDLGAFSQLPSQCAMHRTSPNENLSAFPPLALAGSNLNSVLIPQSVTTYVLTNVTPGPVSSHPQAWYPFERNALDASGNANPGTIVGGVTFVPGKLGAYAAQFDGSSGCVRVPLSVSNDFTLSCWVKTTATAATGQWWAGRGLVDGEVSGSVDDFGLALVGDKTGFGVGNPDTTITSVASINDGLWHHIAATRDDVTGQMCLYVDGTLQANAIGPTGTRTAPPALSIGAIQPGYSGGFLAGTIDDVQLYARVFQPAEIGQLMNHPPRFLSSNNAAVEAGTTLTFTNSATDPDMPAQMLAFAMLPGPIGATVSPSTGVLSWRPPVAPSPFETNLTLIVTDNGTPPMSATQTLAVAVARPAPPALNFTAAAAGGLTLTVNGDAGLDYLIEEATNLDEPPLWWPVFTNLAAQPPFSWTDSAVADSARRFYRVLLGP